MMSSDTKFNLNALQGLSEEEKSVALEILKQLASEGKSDILDDLKYSDFEEVPVDIDTFMDDPEYLGNSIWAIDSTTGEKRCTLFPYWRDNLHKIFPDNLTTSCNTLILTGSIGLGKSQQAINVMLYLLYRMLCLKDPYGYYGMMPNDKISFSMLNTSLDTAKGVAWDKLQQMVQASPWFMRHGALNASRTNPTWQPEKHIELLFGSSNNHVVGRALFCNFSDEVNFSATSTNVEAQKKKLLKMIGQIDARMISRFGKGTYLPTMNIIASSKDTEQSFLDTYINTKRQNESKTTIIVDEAQWVIRNDKGSPNDPGAFYVAVGDKFLPHELLPQDASEELVESYRAKGYAKIIKVPPIYREHFETNLDQALMDDAGISSASTVKFISGKKLNEAKVENYRNPFAKDVIEVGDNIDDYLQYANFFDMSAIDPNDISKPLFIHLDMSMGAKGKGDKTGIAGVIIDGKYPSIPGQEESLSLRYKLLFSVSVKAPRGYNISFIKNQNFIKWLREQGFAVKCITADTFQSAPVLQELTVDGFKTETLSVDRVNSDKVCEPYQYLRSAINDRRIKIYKKCDLLTEELVNLERTSTGKIDHPTNGCFTGDTKVSLVDGRELTFLELVEEFENGKQNYVYSFNEKTKVIEPKPIKKAWCTIRNAELVEVELDNGEKIRCTPNHKFMLRTGEYREAKDLLPMDSLMPLYRKQPSVEKMKLYRLYYEPIEDEWHYEHRRFAKEVFDKKYLVHHKDCNPQNNRPDNLIWCSNAAHAQIHAELQTGAQSETANQKRKASLSQYYANNKDNPVFINRNLKISKTLTDTEKAAKYAAYIKDIEETFDISWAKLSVTERDSYAVKYQRLKNPNTSITIGKKVAENHKKGLYKNAINSLAKENELSKQLKTLIPEVDLNKFEEIFGFRFESLPATKRPPYIVKYRKILGKEILNHKVVAVRTLTDREDVYDIEVEDNHNFALSSGVFVHNSKDQADGVCGALYTASKYAEEYAYNYGDNLKAVLDTNLTNDEIDFKQQYITNFEAELAKIYEEENEALEEEKKQKHQDYLSYQDILDGIINL